MVLSLYRKGPEVDEKVVVCFFLSSPCFILNLTHPLSLEVKYGSPCCVNVMDDISEMILDSEQVVEGVSKNFVKVRILKIFKILNSLKSCSFNGIQYFVLCSIQARRIRPGCSASPTCIARTRGSPRSPTSPCAATSRYTQFHLNSK